SQPPHSCPCQASSLWINLSFQGNWHGNLRRNPNLPCSLKTGGGYTNDDKGNIVDIDLPANCRRVTAKTALPIAITQHNNRTGVCLVIFIGNGAPQKRPQPQPCIIVTGNHLAAHIFC